MLLRLVGTLRNQNEPAFVDVINLIRSNAPMDEINACLTASQVVDHASVEDDGPAKIPKRSPSMYMDVKRITDIPVFQVPAKPWTSVTADDAFVSHLISLYFTWQQPTFMWVDRDPFLSDMKAGKLGSRFCSPLLVNILLAVACVSTLSRQSQSHFPENQSKRSMLRSSSIPTILSPLQTRVTPRLGVNTSLTRQWTCSRKKREGYRLPLSKQWGICTHGTFPYSIYS